MGLGGGTGNEHVFVYTDKKKNKGFIHCEPSGRIWKDFFWFCCATQQKGVKGAKACGGDSDTQRNAEEGAGLQIVKSSELCGKEVK